MSARRPAAPRTARLATTALAVVTGGLVLVAPAWAAPVHGEPIVSVGTQIDQDAWVPDGTTTSGTRLELTETGPDLDGSRVSTCITEPSSGPSGANPRAGYSPSYCPKAYRLPAGRSLSVRQVDQRDGLLPGTDPITVPPCEVAPGETS